MSIDYSTTEAWILEDLRDRLRNAEATLVSLARQRRDAALELYPKDPYHSRLMNREAERLEHKASGVALALDHLRAYPSTPDKED